jgi:N4-gp56 family major capsid protein
MMFWKGCDYRTLPLKNGKMIQWFRYSQLDANTTPTTEGGGPGASLEMSSGVVQSTVAQYADFISLSDLLVDTAIDGDIAAVAADQLGYRGGLTANKIIRNEVDSVAASIDVSLIGEYFTGADCANIRHRLAGIDVTPFPDGFFKVLAHPYVLYDFMHDPAVGGFQDMVKYSAVEGGGRFTKM